MSDKGAGLLLSGWRLVGTWEGSRAHDNQGVQRNVWTYIVSKGIPRSRGHFMLKACKNPFYEGSFLSVLLAFSPFPGTGVVEYFGGRG
ncbi:hypothetical protein XELAEV_18003068mg [Xenopus laevis]|uniref:Uncharacterized protein n=1 Tax=Xenopus laevis TaxID=8355 RepID=A0A974BPY4_XENLA|nr:hypothetical protein XELAEV_18003068mg [Xenopus laevis]